ncbi:MAG: dihydrofolate reductase [Psittacicella sp.]
MNISLIAAIDLKGVIGYKNTLPWHLPDDLAYFKEKTLKKPVLMGFNTFKSIGRTLPNRLNIIISKNHYTTNPEDKNIIFYKSIDDALKNTDCEELMVIGGEQIFNSFINLANKIYITKINYEFQGDTFFPKIDNSWKIIFEQYHPKDDKHRFDFTFYTYVRS